MIPEDIECMRRAAIEMLLGGGINWTRRAVAKRALHRSDFVPAAARRYPHIFEAWVTCCMTAAKAERLKRLLRRGLH
jgi:hypothetical protein